MSGFFLLCALPPEAAAAKAGLLLHERRGTTRAPGIAARAGAGNGAVRIVGMGPDRAGRACDRLASSLPAGVPAIILGIGGALISGLEPGDLVVARAVGRAGVRAGRDELEVTTAPRPFDARSDALGALLAGALGERFASTSRAPLLTTDRLVRDDERARLAQCGAVICDTESAALMRLAERRPFAIVRAVVDSPERELVSLRTISGGIRGLRRLGEAAGIIAGVLEHQPVSELGGAAAPAQRLQTPQSIPSSHQMSPTSS